VFSGCGKEEWVPQKLTPLEALKEAKNAARAGMLKFSEIHYERERKDERKIYRPDVAHAVRSATHALWQPDHGTWKLTGGTNRQGEPIVVCVGIAWVVTVVTVW
jgi:hypothetical protein